MTQQQFAYVGVDPIIVFGRLVVLAKRGADAGAEEDAWHLPGALIKAGERIEEALRRAVLEKTGLEIAPLFETYRQSFVAMYDDQRWETRYHDIALSFMCRVTGGKLRPGPRMAEVRTFRPDEIDRMHIGFDHARILRDGMVLLREHHEID